MSPVPLWLTAGAITVTSRLGFAASCWTSASIPGAPTPSSLGTRTRSGADGAADAVAADAESRTMASRVRVRMGRVVAYPRARAQGESSLEQCLGQEAERL